MITGLKPRHKHGGRGLIRFVNSNNNKRFENTDTRTGTLGCDQVMSNNDNNNNR